MATGFKARKTCKGSQKQDDKLWGASLRLFGGLEPMSRGIGGGRKSKFREGQGEGILVQGHRTLYSCTAVWCCSVGNLGAWGNFPRHSPRQMAGSSHKSWSSSECGFQNLRSHPCLDSKCSVWSLPHPLPHAGLHPSSCKMGLITPPSQVSCED